MVQIITYVAGEFVNCPIFWHVIFLVRIILRREERDIRQAYKEIEGIYNTTAAASELQACLSSLSQQPQTWLSQCHLLVLRNHSSYALAAEDHRGLFSM